MYVTIPESVKESIDMQARAIADLVSKDGGNVTRCRVFFAARDAIRQAWLDGHKGE